MVKRALYSAPQKTKRLLYQTLFLHHIEYSAVAWDLSRRDNWTWTGPESSDLLLSRYKKHGMARGIQRKAATTPFPTKNETPDKKSQLRRSSPYTDASYGEIIECPTNFPNQDTPLLCKPAITNTTPASCQKRDVSSRKAAIPIIPDLQIRTMLCHNLAYTDSQSIQNPFTGKYPHNSLHNVVNYL